MEYTTDRLEMRITIDGKRYVYELVVTGYAEYEKDVNYTSFSSVTPYISNVTKYGKEVNSEELELEIAFQLESELEDILRSEGSC
jgi:hypothetical protein